MAPILMNSKYTEINQITPKHVKMTLPSATGIIIRIWLDFYEDDMLPWVLSRAGIHKQKLNPGILESLDFS
jgi:hypothetical protein